MKKKMETLEYRRENGNIHIYIYINLPLALWLLKACWYSDNKVCDPKINGSGWEVIYSSRRTAHTISYIGFLHNMIQDDVIHWKHFRVTKCEWHGALMFSLTCAWTNGWSNNQDAGDLIRHSAHYDVTVMYRAVQQTKECIFEKTVQSNKNNHRSIKGYFDTTLCRWLFPTCKIISHNLGGFYA